MGSDKGRPKHIFLFALQHACAEPLTFAFNLAICWRLRSTHLSKQRIGNLKGCGTAAFFFLWWCWLLSAVGTGGVPAALLPTSDAGPVPMMKKITQENLPLGA